MTDPDGTTVHDAVGGSDFFVALVDRFYVEVEGEPRLRRLYPDDLTASKRDLAEFLAQYWGGPPVYSSRKGHPRLRMRHARFAIGPAEREAWLRAMTSAVEAAECDDEVRGRLLAYFEMAATHLLNTDP